MTKVMIGVHSTNEPIGPARHITFDAWTRVGASGRRVAAPLSVPMGPVDLINAIGSRSGEKRSESVGSELNVNIRHRKGPEAGFPCVTDGSTSSTQSEETA
jgi:hypothetical protein